MLAFLALVALHLFDQVLSKSLADGSETIPAYCQHYNPANDFSDASTALKLSYELELIKKAEANQSSTLIRIGCPRNYKIFGEFHCVPGQYLEQYRTGAMTWSQLQASRVSKSSLANVNRDTGRCATYGPAHNPTVAFDDDHCIPFASVCLYKFGKYQFDWVLSHREQFPFRPNGSPAASGRQPIGNRLPSKNNCQRLPLYVEFDETHCVAQSAVENFIAGAQTWDQLLEQKVHKFHFGTATTTTTTPKPPPARKQIDLIVLKLVIPLIRPYIKNVVNKGQMQEISFYDPPGMTGRRNWKQFDAASFGREGHSRLGLLRDLQKRPVISTNVAPCWTPEGKRGRCKLMTECFQRPFYASLDAFLDHSCSAGRGVVGICCSAKAPNMTSQAAFTASDADEWNHLVASVEAEWKRSAGTTTARPVKTRNRNELQVISWLQPIVGDWVVPSETSRSPELLVKIPDRWKQEMRKRKNWRTYHPWLKLDKFGFGFGKLDRENIVVPCEMHSGQRGVCRSASRCLQPELYRSRQVLVDSLCPRGTALGLCCKEDAAPSDHLEGPPSPPATASAAGTRSTTSTRLVHFAHATTSARSTPVPINRTGSPWTN